MFATNLTSMCTVLNIFACSVRVCSTACYRDESFPEFIQSFNKEFCNRQSMHCGSSGGSQEEEELSPNRDYDY